MKNHSKLGNKDITICMDVFGIDDQIEVGFDYYFGLLPVTYEVIKANGIEKARLIYNQMIGKLSAKAESMFDLDKSSWPDEDIAVFNGNCFIATLLGNLLAIAPSYIKADWNFEPAIKQINCPCCGDKLSLAGGN